LAKYNKSWSQQLRATQSGDDPSVDIDAVAQNMSREHLFGSARRPTTFTGKILEKWG